MYRLPAFALSAGLLLSAVGATPPAPTQPGMPPPAAPAPPMATLAPAQTGPAGPTSATPAPNPAMLARAKKWFAMLQAGKVDRSQLAPNMGSLTEDQIKSVQAQIGNLGTPVTFEQQQAMTQGGVSYAVYLLTFGNAKKLNFVFAVDGQGKIAGLRLTPAP